MMYDPCQFGEGTLRPLGKELTDRLIDDYYEERGWDKETGDIIPQKLKELALEGLL